MLPALLLIAAAHGPLSFIEDDYPKALAEARAQHKPLFIDFWATWCHSCLSMQRFVLSDPGMKPVADAAVWSSVETEREPNKAVVEKYPVDAWPTFLIVDPDSGAVLGRFLGSGTYRTCGRSCRTGCALTAKRAGRAIRRGRRSARPMPRGTAGI